MLGAIAGDYIGSRFEANPTKKKDFTLITSYNTFTDDTVLTIAIADSLMQNKAYAQALKEYFRLYPRAGYGGNFQLWASTDNYKPYFSFGNGSAMRVSPIGWYFNELHKVLEEAQNSAAVTHNHPEGIKGAQATALSIYLARQDNSKKQIKDEIESRFKYNLSAKLEDIRPIYHFDVTCQGSVPESIIAFLEADDYEDAIRNAVSLGGDSDTQACIAGAIAEAYFKKIPDHIVNNIMNELDDFLKQKVNKFLDIITKGT